MRINYVCQSVGINKVCIDILMFCVNNIDVSKSMYDIIKRQNGERFAKAIRNYDNGIFDVPNLDYIVRYAGRDAEPIMQYLLSLKDVHITQMSRHYDPIALLQAAGYDAYIADTFEKQNAISKYFAAGEALCTFRDATRFERYHIINAVHRDAAKLHRSDFINPQREDAYGTSVISIQILKQGGFISIKNRYNHTVDSCDNTFNSNPDNIIMGLSDALRNYFGVDFSTVRTDLPRGYTLVGDRICQYLQEVNNVYLGTNYYISDGCIHDVNTQHEVMLGGGLIFDIVNRRTVNVTDLFMDVSFLDDAFRNRAFQQTKDRQTGVRTLMADGRPVLSVRNGEMTHIDVPNADSVTLSYMQRLSGTLDFSHAILVELSYIDTTHVKDIKMNPNANAIKITHSALPACAYDFSGVKTLILNNSDISRVTEFKANPTAAQIVISNVKFPPCDFDFSGVDILGLPNCDLSAVKSIKFNPNGYRINLRGAKLPAQKFDLSGVQDVILDGADTTLTLGINLNPNSMYTGITPTAAQRMIRQYHER